MAEQEGGLEIKLGQDSFRPTDPKAQRIKSWTNFIATTAALLAAVAGLLKPQDHTATKNSYEELRKAIELSNAESKKNHDDMTALHNYLEGYFSSNESMKIPQLSQPSPSPQPSAVHPGGTGKKIANPHTITFGVSPTSGAPYAPSAPEPLPPIHDQADYKPLPSYDSVAGQK